MHPRSIFRNQYGNVRFIPLTQGRYAMVDEGDFEWLSQWKWSAQFITTNQKYYARRGEKLAVGKWTGVAMARQILGLERGDRRIADHREPAMTLDNRRSNLRIATPSQNNMNLSRNCRNKSGHRGVSWDSHNKIWVAQIGVNHKIIQLCRSHDKLECAEAYAKASEKYHGDFGRIY